MHGANIAKKIQPRASGIKSPQICPLASPSSLSKIQNKGIQKPIYDPSKIYKNALPGRQLPLQKSVEKKDIQLGEKKMAFQKAHPSENNVFSKIFSNTEKS